MRGLAAPDAGAAGGWACAGTRTAPRTDALAATRRRKVRDNAREVSMGPDIRTVGRAGVGLSTLVAAVVMAIGCVESHSRSDAGDKTVPAANAVVADKPFVSGGRIAMQLDGGGYEV